MTNLREAALNLDGGIGTGDVAMAVIGLDNQYPAIGLAGRVDAQGAAVIEKLKTQCVFPSILDYQSLVIKDCTKNGETLAQLMQEPVISAAIEAQRIVGRSVPMPLLQYQGRADEFVPIGQNVVLKQQYCAAGTRTQFLVYPSEHIATQFQAAPDVLSWISDRIAGKAAPNTCGTETPAPTSTAPPRGGNFTVNIDSWALGGTLNLKNLGASLALPPGATFSGITDLTLKQLRDGRITSPTFTTTLKAFGALTLDVTVAIQQVGATGGSASLDGDGILHIDGSTSLTIKLQNVVGLGLPVVDAPDCQTAVPVTLPLKFDGPVSSLGNGNLTLTGQATFPKLQNCGLLTDALNLLFPGSGNDFAFTVTPPAPTRY